MRQPRLVTFGIAITLAATLVACGGGGGGTTPAVSAPGNPGAPSTTVPPSTTSPSAPPSGATTSPSSPTPVPSVQTVGPSSAMIDIGYGETNGNPQPLLVSTAANTNTDPPYPGSGNLEPGDSGATTTGGPNGNGGGGQGSAIDGINCQPSMGELYHVHFFLGIYHNGQQVAVPAGVGMVNPHYPNQYVVNDQPTSTPAPTQTYYGVPNQSWTAQCFYDMHVHDNSGMVHIETTSNGQCNYYTYYPATPAPGQPLKPCNYPSPWTLANFFDEWGISIGPDNFGPLQGAVQMYSTPPGYDSYSACGTDGGGNVILPCHTSSSLYQLVYPNSNGTTPYQVASSIKLQSHTTIWIVVGTPLPTGLPSINWVEGNP